MLSSTLRMPLFDLLIHALNRTPCVLKQLANIYNENRASPVGARVSRINFCTITHNMEMKIASAMKLVPPYLHILWELTVGSIIRIWRLVGRLSQFRDVHLHTVPRVLRIVRRHHAIAYALPTQRA
jgi:hypothetical protein